MNTDDLRHDHHGCSLCKRTRAAAADEIERLRADVLYLRHTMASLAAEEDGDTLDPRAAKYSPRPSSHDRPV